MASTIRKYAALKYVNLVIGVVFGFLQIYVFSHALPLEDTAFILTVYGLFYYFTFMDLGLTKPFYAKIRQHFINGKMGEYSFWPEVCISVALSALVFTIFLIVALLFAYRMQTSIGLTPIILIALVFSANFGFNFLRPFFDAIDLFHLYEKFDIFRRSGMLLSLYLVTLDHTLFSHAIGLLLSTFAVYALTVRRLATDYGAASHRHDLSFLRVVLARFKIYWPDATRYLNFTLSETLVNNLGLFLFPLLFTPVDVVVYSIWIRLYRGAAMFPRTALDIKLHGITRCYFSNDFSQALARYKTAILIAFLMASLFAICGIFFGDAVVAILSDNTVQAPTIAWVCLAAILLTNVFQHSGGSFLLSTGKYFAYCQRVANYVLVFGGLTVAIVSVTSRNSQAFFLLYTLIFLVSAAFYYRKTYSVLKASK